MLAADQVFRSPCLVLEGERFTLALVPDLDAVSGLNRAGMRTALSLEGGTLTFGITGHRVKGHVYFEARTFPGFEMREGSEAVLAYHLFAAPSGAAAHRRVNSFLWENYGGPRSRRPGPQAIPLAEGARLAGNWAFGSDENWVEMKVGGKECGGTYSFNMNSRFPPLRRGRLTGSAFILLPRLYPAVLEFGAAHVTSRPALYRLLRRSLGAAPGVSPSAVQLQSWFCNVRSAYGAAWLARESGDGELARRASLVRELALASPRPHGFFPAALCLVGGRQVWRKGTRGFVFLDRYHLADSCTTGYHLLEWQRDLEEHPAVPEACRRQADAVAALQMPGGAFPAWFGFRRGKLIVDPRLAESAESAAAVMFLGLLANLTGDGGYLASARAGGEFLLREVVAPNVWYDFEAFFSCSPKRVGWTDRRSGCRPENTMCMYWTAAAFLQLYLAGGEDRYLEAGRKALDRLLAYQQVWSPPFLSVDAFGGFASQNTDAEWNDARQALFASLLVDYYHATGEAELFERGAAALRACLTTMYLGAEPYVPLRPSVRGAVEENYAHFGYDAPAPGYLETDWGAGSFLYAAARILGRHGQVYVDLPAGKAFGIDGCAVEGMRRAGDTVELTVASHLPGPRELELVFRADGPEVRPVVNGRDLGPLDAARLRRGLRVRVD
jgi:hypothetical protein